MAASIEAMLEYDPFSKDIIHGDKYAVYRALRDESPVHYIPRFDAWAVSRFQDVWDVCADPVTFCSSQGTTAAHVLTKVQPVGHDLNSMDPPAHTRLRAELRRFFSPGRIRKLEATIRGFAIEAIEGFEERGACDAVTDFAQIVATDVGCEVAGFPREDRELLRSFVERFFERDPETDGMTEGGLAAFAEMLDYFVKLSASRRSQPAREDALGVLQRFEDDGGHPLSDEQISSHLFLLLVGGTDTFPKVFANLLLRLFQQPDDRARVTADPSLGTAAFNEVVRLDMPTQFMCRVLTRDYELHGQTLREGQPILLLYAAANRDEREFERPDDYDPWRRSERSLAFSHGTHACIGLHVARAEGQIALEELLRRFPEYEIDTEGLERYGTEFVQGYSRMPTRWRP
jgi:cytochrome P450